MEKARIDTGPSCMYVLCVRERVLVCNGNVAERSKAAALGAVGVLVLPPGVRFPPFPPVPVVELKDNYV